MNQNNRTNAFAAVAAALLAVTPAAFAAPAGDGTVNPAAPGSAPTTVVVPRGADYTQPGAPSRGADYTGSTWRGADYTGSGPAAPGVTPGMPIFAGDGAPASAAPSGAGQTNATRSTGSTGAQTGAYGGASDTWGRGAAVSPGDPYGSGAAVSSTDVGKFDLQ